jgi:hypothetical protein
MNLSNLCWAAPFLWLLGCAGSSTSEFVGTWEPISGTTSLTCDGKPTARSVASTDNDAWVDNEDGTIALSNQFGGLSAAAVSGNTASLPASTRPGVWLELFPGTGPVSPVTNIADGSLSLNVALTHYEFVLDPDHAQAIETYSGTAHVADDDMDCTIAAEATYRRLTN